MRHQPAPTRKLTHQKFKHRNQASDRDWEADSGDRWTVPVGLGVYKTGPVIGKLPMKIGVEAQWMAVSPDGYGQEWNIRIVIAPIIPAPWGALAGRK